MLVLGASFAGIELVYQLVRLADGKPPRITVVDRQSTHGYLPLVQERLCGVLDEAPSRLDTRAFLESVPGASFVQDTVVGFDPETKTATLASGKTLTARFVVVALGSAFEAPASVEGAAHIETYKSQEDYTRTQQRIAELLGESERARRAEVVVVGGGISGCELAGELAQLSVRAPDGWTAPRVRLVSRAEGVATHLGSRIANKAITALTAQGVTIETSTDLVEVDGEHVTLRARGESNTRTEPADLVLWAGGLQPAPVLAKLGLPRTPRGWLQVGPSLQCFATARPTHPDIFACGDAVRVVGGDGEWPTMQRAIECIWQAKVVAKNLLKLAGEPRHYPEGVPPLLPHKCRETFFFGLSLGARSMVVYRGFGLDVPGVNHWFRRWLMRQYLSRYAPLPGG